MNKPPTFQFRPGTIDEAVFQSVFERNEYRVPPRLPSGSVVVDIGVHVGSFSCLVLTRGAAKVYGFEPEPGNLAQARRNLQAFGSKVELFPFALWRSDVVAQPLHFWPSSDRANTGGGTVIWETDGPVVDSVPFDDAIARITTGGQRIALLKIDCEGAEFPILLTSKRLGWIDRIVGEYHELKAVVPLHARVPGVDKFALESLVAHLEANGFSVSVEKQTSGEYGDMGLFFAARPRKSGSWLRRLFGSRPTS